jgi:hypothetical protein
MSDRIGSSSLIYSITEPTFENISCTVPRGLSNGVVGADPSPGLNSGKLSDVGTAEDGGKSPKLDIPTSWESRRPNSLRNDLPLEPNENDEAAELWGPLTLRLMLLLEVREAETLDLAEISESVDNGLVFCLGTGMPFHFELTFGTSSGSRAEDTIDKPTAVGLVPPVPFCCFLTAASYSAKALAEGSLTVNSRKKAGLFFPLLLFELCCDCSSDVLDMTSRGWHEGMPTAFSDCGRTISAIGLMLADVLDDRMRCGCHIRQK